MRVVIITGAGNKAFSDGADLNQLSQTSMLDDWGRRGPGLFWKKGSWSLKGAEKYTEEKTGTEVCEKRVMKGMAFRAIPQVDPEIGNAGWG